MNVFSAHPPFSLHLVHSKNGAPVGCGIVERIPVRENELVSATTTNLTMSGVSSDVLVHAIKPDVACYFGRAQNLEPNLISYLNTKKSRKGSDCTIPNGCGVHIHNGPSCLNKTTQGSHAYNRKTLQIDPWLSSKYHATDENGDAYFTGCVEMGVSSFIGNTFIVRSNNGKRVSCGVLKGDMKNAFVLIDPKSDQSLGELGTVVNYTSLKTKSNLLNIEAKFIKPYKSVRVTFDNPKRSFCEKAAPFSVFGDERGNFHGEAIPLGSHVVTAIPYVENNCNGSPGNKLSQKFVVVLEQVRKE